jgi:hypothetical protein
MSKHSIGGRKAQRRIAVAAAATALATFGPAGIAGADESDSGGDKNPVRDAISSVTDTARSVADRITAGFAPGAASNPGAGRGSGPFALVRPETTVANRSVIVRRSDTTSAPTAALVPTLTDDGFNFGTGGSCPNDNCGINTGPGINIFRFGNDNDDVANNTVDPGSFGTNLVFLGNGNELAGRNTVIGDGSLGSNLSFLGNNNFGSGFNEVDGDRSFGSNLAFLGNDNDNSGFNFVQGNDSFGSNLTFPVLGGANSDFAGVNTVVGNNSSGINLAILSIGNARSGNNTVDGNNSSGANLAVVGPFTTDSGRNTVVGDGRTGFNLAGVGGFGSNNGNNERGGLNLVYVDPFVQNSGNNRAGGINIAMVGLFSQNSGNNNAGGINIAIMPTSFFANGVGNCNSSACVNLFGFQLLGG